MFTLTSDALVRPFVVAPRERWARLPDSIRDQCRHYDPLSDADAAFCLAMNRANCVAYDGAPTPGVAPGALGMPLWVMLDCCLLTSVMTGFEVDADAVPAEVRQALDPEGVLGALGVSEYVALPTDVAGEVVGVSLFSLLRGLRLGERSKALGLLALGAHRMTGVAQYTNPAVKLHLRFGELRVVSARARVHSRPLETFVYDVRLPDPPTLDAMATGVVMPGPVLAPPDAWFDPRDAAQVADFVGQGGAWSIVQAGDVVDDQLASVGVRRMSSQR